MSVSFFSLHSAPPPKNMPRDHFGIPFWGDSNPILQFYFSLGTNTYSENKYLEKDISKYCLYYIMVRKGNYSNDDILAHKYKVLILY